MGLRGMAIGKAPKTPAKGARVANGLVRIVVSFDEDTFNDVAALARENHTSFAEQVRTLVEWGMMELET